MGIKYCMEGFIKYLKIYMVGHSNQGFTDHSVSGRSLILRSVITIAEDNMQDQHSSCITGYNYTNVHLTSLIWRGAEMYIFFYVFLPYTVQDMSTVSYLGLYISMDSLTLMLPSFSQIHFTKAQDNINVLLEQMKMAT